MIGTTIHVLRVIGIALMALGIVLSWLEHNAARPVWMSCALCWVMIDTLRG